MSEVTLRKHQCIPCLDTSTTSGTESWQRIDKSTIFELSLNPQSTTEDYIAYETPVNVTDHYEPELPQEIITNEGNPIYDFIFEKMYNLPIGDDLQVPLLICFPGSGKKAWRVKKNMIELQAFNSVDKKITWVNKLGGDIEKGTYSISSSTGAITFTPASSSDG